MSTKMEKTTPGPWVITHLDAEYQQISMICETTGQDPACHTVCHQPVTGDRKANAALIAAAPEFLAACQGRPSAEVTNLEWLSALLCELRVSDWPATTLDPSASWEALAQSESLLLGLREAMKKAQGSGEQE